MEMGCPNARTGKSMIVAKIFLALCFISMLSALHMRFAKQGFPYSAGWLTLLGGVGVSAGTCAFWILFGNDVSASSFIVSAIVGGFLGGFFSLIELPKRMRYFFPKQ